jgi:ferritin-like metal-binding protein YciE
LAIVAPALIVRGFGIHMLHNTLQTNATQMAPEARGLAVSTFANVLFMGANVLFMGANVLFMAPMCCSSGKRPTSGCPGCSSTGSAILPSSLPRARPSSWSGSPLRCCSMPARQPAERSRGAKELIDLRAVSTWLARHRAMAGEVSAAQFGNRGNARMAVKSVNDLLMDELQDMYHAEKQLVKALPKMAKKAKSDKLRQAVEHHLEQTKGHVQRLEQVFEQLDARPRAKKCEAMEGLIAEAEELMGEITTPEVLDAAMIAAAQKVEHYEIASYGTLNALAEELGHTQAARLLEQTLNEEKAADQKLNEIALSGVNKTALQAAA